MSGGEMNPKLAAQQSNLMLGGEKWEPSSTNRSTYTWHDAGKAYAEAQASAGALKRTYYKAHFELGADATEYVSSNASAYERPQQARSTKVNHDRAIMTQPNFYLGLEKADMRSMASTDYDAKVVDVRATRATAAALKKDLQSSHFEFGADAPTLRSSAARDYAPPARADAERVRQQREIKVNTTLLRAQNFDTPTHTFFDETSGKQPDPRDYPGSYSDNRSEMRRLKSTLQKTNFMLGESELDYRSQAMMMTGEKKKHLHQPISSTIRAHRRGRDEKK